jgi:excisionase family DNA binding protein
MILLDLLASFETLAKSWRNEAAKRRKVWPEDPTTSAFDYTAGELEQHARELRDGFRTLTVEQYAALHGKSPQTIRNWIHRGELEAEQHGRGYRLSPTARRKSVA